MSLLIRSVKWITCKIADHWIVFLITSSIGLGFITIVREEIKYLFKIILLPVAVPQYVFWPWLCMTIARILIFLWNLLTQPPLTAQKSYRSDIEEGFLWRWDVTENQSNSRLYGIVHNLKKYCSKCKNVGFDVDRSSTLDQTQTRVTCQKCKQITSVTDFFHLESRVKAEIERKAATQEWKSATQRIKEFEKLDKLARFHLHLSRFCKQMWTK